MSTAAAVLLAHNLSLSRATAQPRDKMERAVPYDREVLLTGRLVRRTFAGPPGYSSVAKGDRAERVPVLELDHEVRVSHPHFPRENPHTVRRIQLWTARHDSKEQASLERAIASAVGRRVVVIATLSVGFTWHHHTPVMGHLQQLKLKGTPDFPAVERLSPEELAAAEAKEAARLEQLLKDDPPVDLGPVAQFHRYTRLRGTLVERRPPAAASEDGWVEDGTKICWVLQLDQPITISPSQYDEGLTDVREVAIWLRKNDPLVKRDLRALGIEAPVPWRRGAAGQLFGKRYEVVGRLSANPKTLRDHTPCAAAQLGLSRIYPTPD